MRGSSRGAYADSLDVFEASLAGVPDRAALADDLFAVSGLIDGDAVLRRALTDPSREGDQKRNIATALLKGKISEAAVAIVAQLAAGRWADERDLGDSLERLAVQAVLGAAEQQGRADRVEDELFRFERIVAANPDLRDALTNRQGDPKGKAEVVEKLLGGKAAPETVRLARQSVLAPRGRRLDRTLEEYLAIAAKRREQVTAVVSTAVALDAEQQRRLAAALERIYSRKVLLQLVHDPEVVGGIRVQVGDEVVDGTVLKRLEQARRHIAGA
ncbi:F0F1 ATP synthase subunit delta [Janibacter sp. GXQ6167]|uniref:F0F1 ATP synthase subunit delta n=1 Tax=Janibacter sp. GXQ6167 TaxID=3240791 RepID=UPI0035253188